MQLYQPLSDATVLAPVLEREFPQGYAIDNVRQIKSGALVSLDASAERHVLLVKNTDVLSHQVTWPTRRQII